MRKGLRSTAFSNSSPIACRFGRRNRVCRHADHRPCFQHSGFFGHLLVRSHGRRGSCACRPFTPQGRSPSGCLAGRDKQRHCARSTIRAMTATILMFLMARVGGDPTREQIAVIEKIVRTVFELHGKLVERINAGALHRQAAQRFRASGRELRGSLQQAPHDQRKTSSHLHVEEVAQVDGPSEAQLAALQVLQRRIGIAATLRVPADATSAPRKRCRPVAGWRA